jgi:uncharacterized protein with WD repeat
MDFWDLRPVLHKLNTRHMDAVARKFATAQAPYTHHIEWSPDGNFLLTAVLFSRFKTDNGFTIFKYSHFPLIPYIIIEFIPFRHFQLRFLTSFV